MRIFTIPEIIEEMFAEYYSSIFSGILSGSLHAITGPDHFTAILPRTLHLRWWYSGFYGGCWGFGHGLCSFLVGYVAFVMKEMFLNFPTLCYFAKLHFLSDIMIGLTLSIIGLMGLLEDMEEEAPDNSAKIETNLLDFEALAPEVDEIEVWSKKKKEAISPPPTSLRSSVFRKSILIGTIILNGFVMGLSWDGLPSLTPTLLLNTRQTVSFLAAYLFSTFAIMTLVSGLIGEASIWLTCQLHLDSNKVRIEDFSRKFTMSTSFVAFSIGLLWLCIGATKAFIFLRSTTLNEVEEFPLNNDGIAMGRAINNDGIAMSNRPESTLFPLEEIGNQANSMANSSKFDFYLNLVMSSLSLLLMIISIVYGIFYPDNAFEKTITRFAFQLQSILKMMEQRFKLCGSRIVFICGNFRRSVFPFHKVAD